MHIRTLLGLIASSVAALVMRAAESAVPFQALTLDAAAKRAAAENKVVFIDFYTTWCGPCKMLDAKTWTNADVGQLVGAKAVALRLDAEKEGRDLAQRYRIDAYPTLLVLKPDGTELDRIVGFREPAAFITDFTAAIEGRTALKRAAEASAKSEAVSLREQVRARQQLANELTRNHKYEEALQEYLWLFDEGMKQDPGFAGVRTSFLTSDMGRLAARYEPAAAALRERRDAAKKRLLEDPDDRSAPGEFVALNDALGDNAANLAMFDRLPAGDRRRQGMGLRVYRELAKAKRYRDALDAHSHRSMLGLFDALVGNLDRSPEEMRGRMRENALNSAMTDLEVLVGAGELNQARAMRERILSFDSSDETKAKISEVLKQTGQPEL